MALIFEDLFDGALNAEIASRPPNVGPNWANISGDAHFVLNGAGKVVPGLSGGLPWGQAQVDIVIPAGSAKLIIEAPVEIDGAGAANGRFTLTMQRLSAPATPATGGVEFDVDVSGSNPNKFLNVYMNTVNTGGSNGSFNQSFGSSTAFCEQEHIWRMEIDAGLDTARWYVDGAVLVPSPPNLYFAAAGGLLTDYGVRVIYRYMFFSGAFGGDPAVGRYVRVATGSLLADSPESGGAPPLPFWTDYINTHEVP